MQTRKKTPKALLAPIILLVLALFVYHNTGHNPSLKTDRSTSVDKIQKSSPDTKEQLIEKAKALAELHDREKALPKLDFARVEKKGIWNRGRPTFAKPGVRGANSSRKYGSPKDRELPDEIENSVAAVMAMIPVDGRQELLPEEIDLHTLRSRRMVLDTGALDSVVAGETNKIIAPTPGDEVLELKISKIRTRTEQTHSIMGKIEGEELSDVNIVYHDGIVHGTVARYDKNQHFEYRVLPDGHMMVRELDVSSIPWKCGNPNADGQVAGNGASGQSFSDAYLKNAAVAAAEILDEDITITPVSTSGPTVSRDTSGWTTVDVVVGYGAAARASQGGTSAIEAHIIAAVDRMSNSFVNSLVTNTEIMLLGTIEDPSYVSPGANATDMGSADELGDLADGADGSLDTVSDYGTLLGADLYAFVVDSGQGGTAGIAYRPGRHSITSRTAMTSSGFTFCHELGHNLGARHSWGDSGDTTNNTSRFGLRFEGNGGSKYRTIMAYNNGSWGGASRIPHYANPNVSFDGVPTGLPTGSNQTGNTDIDPAYISGGFDGSNPDLGARNGEMLLVTSGSNGVAPASARATRTALGITAPVSGPSWAAGSSQVISFTGGDMEYTATIDLYKGGVYQYNIATIDAIDHSFTWDIPLAQEGGNDFRIRVTLDHNDTPATSFVESDFFVIQGTSDIILQSPIGGETFTQSSKTNIIWSSSYGGNVSIEYKKGAASPVTIVASTPDDGSYEWTIPQDLALGSDYIIIITSDVDPFDSSQSPGTFSVVAPSNDLLVTNLDSDPGFTTTGEFEYGIPGASNSPTSAFSGSNCYDTNLTASCFTASSLTTAAIDCSNHTNIVLEFYAHALLYGGYSAVFEISTDNVNWTNLAPAEVGSSNYGSTWASSATWTKFTYDITDTALGQSTVYVRWSMTGSGTQWGGGGLAIDDISITGDFIPADGISVVTPNGGESMIPLIQNEITWLSGIGGDVQIDLMKNGSLDSTIAHSTPNDGSFFWTPPAAQTLGSDYTIQITSLEPAGRDDVSDTNFSIVAAPSASSIPYAEGFNNTFGVWTQATSDNIDWTTRTGSTPSSNTGPTAAQEGTHYIYTEASNNTNSTAVLTAWFDLTNSVSPELSFYYHMFGAAMGSLVIEASSDGSTYTSVFQQSGDQGNTWTQAQVGLSDFAGKYVQLRITGTTGSDFRSDMAIDNMSITETATTTFAITYNANATITGTTPAGQTKGENVDITLADAGTMSRSGFQCTGWNTDQFGTGTAYGLGATYTANANITLYAQWESLSDPYTTWAGTEPFHNDANGDGINNGLAWLLGAASPTATNGGAPTSTTSGDDLVMTFQYVNSANRGSSILYLEYSTDLGATATWSGNSVAVPETTSTVGGISFVITPNGNVNDVQATVPGTLATDGRIFGRLKAVE